MAMRPEAVRSSLPIRELTADDLEVGGEAAIRAHSSNQADDPQLADDDPVYRTVLDLLDSYGGVIFTGPPGTSKSWYAAKIGTRLVDGDENRIRYVQFHPSYQYEDFMQGFVPNEKNDGFTMKNKYFVKMCRCAQKHPGDRFVLVIDELSRADVGRVFGEALTYVERSKRALPFDLASGERITVPPNLVILATMNPLDRGVDDVDAAFERRFAKIAMDPDRDILSDRLEQNGVSEPLRGRIVGFFNRLNGYAETNPLGAIGHTFFWDVSDEKSFRSVWDHQLRFIVEKAYRLEPETREDLEANYERIFEPEPAEAQGPGNRDAAGDNEQP